MHLKVGQRWKSAGSAVEVIVIRTAGRAVELGVLDVAGERVEVGKRYATEVGDLELLCVKGGQGTLAADGVRLRLKQARPLPSAD